MVSHHRQNDKSAQTDPENGEEILILDSLNKSLFSAWSVAAKDLVDFHDFVSATEMFPHLEALVIGGSVIQIVDFINVAAFETRNDEVTLPVPNGDNIVAAPSAGVSWALPNLRKLVVWGESPARSEIEAVKETLLRGKEAIGVVGFGNLISPQTLTSLQLGGDICVDHTNFC